MRRLPAHVLVGLAVIAAGAAVAVLADRVAGLVTAVIGFGILLPLRPGRRPGEPRRYSRAPPDEPEERRRPDARRDGPGGHAA